MPPLACSFSPIGPFAVTFVNPGQFGNLVALMGMADDQAAQLFVGAQGQEVTYGFTKLDIYALKVAQLFQQKCVR